MARPKRPPREDHQTPFARVLIDFMWNRRNPMDPPLTVGQLAVRLGLTRQTISNWTSGRFTPPLDVVFDVLARLGIPISRLVAEYHALGLPVPPLIEDDTGPIPLAYEPPARAPQDPWQEMIERVSAEAREIGMDSDTIAALVEHIRDRQAGRRPYQQHILAEHTPPYRPTTSPTAAAGPTEADDADEPSAPERHERRSPRRRTPSSPRG